MAIKEIFNKMKKEQTKKFNIERQILARVERIIEEIIPKNKHELNCFCMAIQTKKKSTDRINRDKIRAKINPEVRKRDSYLCCFCNRNVLEVNGSNTIHHKIPDRYSGEHKEDNLLTICLDCHQLLENLIKIVEREAINHTLDYIINNLKLKIKEIK
jgi:5-methylcytosine-specific restriction endonuclease McrA